MTPKQKRFIEAYQGNASQAALDAGYSQKTAYAIGQKLLKNAEIQKAIQERERERLSVVIASREERQTFWSETMRNPAEKMSDRIRASELLGKSEGDFLERVAAQVDGLQPLSLEVNFVDARMERLVQSEEGKAKLHELYEIYAPGFSGGDE
jgi:phage terminase small subunit